VLPKLRKKYNKANRLEMSKDRSLETSMAGCALPTGGLSAMQAVCLTEINAILAIIKAQRDAGNDHAGGYYYTRTKGTAM